MASISGYIAASLDGYIAGPGGSLDWLTKYDGIDAGRFSYDRFIEGIRTVVMGRGTYDAIADMGVDWPYAGRRGIIVTSRALGTPPVPLLVWSAGIDALADHLRGLNDGDVWVVGGGRLQQALIERGALDSLILFMVPEILGGGTPLFPPNGFARTVRLTASGTPGGQCVCLEYDFNPPSGPLDRAKALT